jgi:hypothetical protein
MFSERKEKLSRNDDERDNIMVSTIFHQRKRIKEFNDNGFFIKQKKIDQSS